MNELYFESFFFEVILCELNKLYIYNLLDNDIYDRNNDFYKIFHKLPKKFIFSLFLVF